MPLIVNGETVDRQLIEDEITRLRPEYQRVFVEQSKEEQDKQLGEWAKENVIERVLIQQAAKKEIVVDNVVVEEEYRKLLEDHGDESKLLENNGLKQEDIPKLKADLQLQKQVEQKIDEISGKAEKPAEDVLKKYYDENIETFTAPEQVRAAHIVKHINAETTLEQAKEQIDELYAQMQGGKTFEEIADENSDCPGNAGDLGYFPRGHMVQAFEDVVFNMKPGEVSDVFQSEFGFHIAKVHDYRPEQPIPFDQVKDKIFEKLYEEARNKQIENYVDSLKETAEIVDFETDDERSQRIRVESQTRHQQEQSATPQKARKQLNSILVKPAGPDCNLACTYCFYLEKAGLFPESKVHRMRDNVLEAMIRQAMQQSGNAMSFGWQGGEPTLMGLDFYRKAVEFQQKYGKGQSVGNGLQTNGILLNKEWADFLREYQFLVGLSLDGPEHIHNKYRHLAGGGGTWQKVEDQAKMLLDSDVSVNALSVVNDYSAQFPEEIYNYHKNLGLTFMQFIPCVETDPTNSGKAAPFSVSPEKYGDFLCKTFDLWMSDFKDGQPTTSIRFFDSVFHRYVGASPPDCTLLPACGVYLVVEHNGDIYSCDFFVEPEWKLGNVMDGSLIELLNSERQHAFGEMKSDLPAPCKACEWLKYCFGGCTKDRMRDPQDNNVCHFCDSFKQFYTHAHPRLQELASKWQQEQRRFQQQQQVIAAIQTGQLKPNRNDPCPCGSGKKFKKCCELLLNQATA